MVRACVSTGGKKFSRLQGGLAVLFPVWTPRDLRYGSDLRHVSNAVRVA